VCAGHTTLEALKRFGAKEVKVVVKEFADEAQFLDFNIRDNKCSEFAEWDEQMLADLGAEFDVDLVEMGFDFDMPEEENEGEPEEKGSLSDRFGAVPFSVLNAREGWWQDRKREWLSLGIKSEVGRDANAFNMGMKANKENGWSVEDDAGSGTSIFDPVLCELSYSWFCPVGGQILDPFAGGSVRGVVAGRLGFNYLGCDLRSEQVEANKVQAYIAGDNQPEWRCMDSRGIDTLEVEADMVFSCPPYADLEVYSDDPNDLSTLKYEDFKQAYFEIINKSCSKLKDDSFACFVVGDVRDKKGNYYNFVGDTVEAFKAAGLHYYNEAVLVTCVGSLPIRVGKQFDASRKLGKTHQNILVFVKGDGKKAAKRCGESSCINMDLVTVE
jgi:DNA modification methylase